MILRFPIVQNKFQHTNKYKINHINENHIKFEVSLQGNAFMTNLCIRFQRHYNLCKLMKVGQIKEQSLEVHRELKSDTDQIAIPKT